MMSFEATVYTAIDLCLTFVLLLVIGALVVVLGPWIP
jgi:hypothetical protein